MSGLDLAKDSELKIFPCTIISDSVACEISLNDVEKILKQKFKNPRAVFVAWQIQNIVWGKLEGGKLSSIAEVTPQFWLECRIFNAAEELHLKRVDNKFSGRYITEIDGKENFYTDSFSRFWGENKGVRDGYIKLLDKSRKLCMEIPCDKTNADWYGLLTRNYISSDEETGLCGYTDYRFVAIETAGGVKIDRKK